MNYTGRLIVAHPKLLSTFFKHTVIYIYEDTENGSQGLILNKPSKIAVNEIFAEQGYNITTNQSLYKGGPVHQRAVSMIHTAEWYSSNTQPAGNYNISSDDFMIEKMGSGNTPAAWRMVGGVCGWAPGQLHAEINGIPPFTEDRSWLTLVPSDAIMFEYDGESQWQKALQTSSSQMVNHFF
tara:strand:- start:1512 stop:2054 length:543 start_codon:yes stop_codon:yes gene_type:complete